MEKNMNIYVSLKHSMNNLIPDDIRLDNLYKKGWNVFTLNKKAFLKKNKKTLKDRVYSVLRKCDAIFVLKGEEETKQTLLEISIAKELGLEVYYEKNKYPSVKDYKTVTFNFSDNVLELLATESLRLGMSVERVLVKLIKDYLGKIINDC